MKLIAGLFLMGIFHTTGLFSQQKDSLRWWNPAESNYPVIEGQGWPRSELKEAYERLPARANGLARPQVWALSRNATGLLIRFKTDAEYFKVEYGVKGRLNLPHFSTTGFSGLDLYSVNKDGGWNWAPGKFTFGNGNPGDTIVYQYSLSCDNSGYKKGREFLLYLPIYNTVSWLKIGLPEKAVFTPLPARSEKPIIIYGTSITQGAVSSRAGMAWTSILSRRLDLPFINLGFSGNGTLDKEMIDFVNEVDARIFVLDCLGNLMDKKVFPLEEVKRRLIAGVKTIRAKHPFTPILLPAFAAFNKDRLDQSHGRDIDAMDSTLKVGYDELKASGINDLYILTAAEMNMGMDDTVDGGHPTDLGAVHYADAFEKILRVILKQPLGDISTTKAVLQYREDATHDWRARHQELLKRNVTNPPQVVVLGSTAVRDWATGSWDGVFAKAGAVNFGFAGDRIENILWRVTHQELDGYAAKKVILMAGTDNLALNTDHEIVKGIARVIQAIRVRQPGATIVVTGLLPQKGQEKRIAAINREIVQIAAAAKVRYSDPGNKLLNSAGKVNETCFAGDDRLNEEGYRRLTTALQPLMK